MPSYVNLNKKYNPYVHRVVLFNINYTNSSWRITKTISKETTEKMIQKSEAFLGTLQHQEQKYDPLYDNSYRSQVSS